jgi:hypothetical protein
VKAYGRGIGPIIQGIMIAYTFGSCVSFIVLIGEFPRHRSTALRHPPETTPSLHLGLIDFESR